MLRKNLSTPSTVHYFTIHRLQFNKHNCYDTSKVVFHMQLHAPYNFVMYVATDLFPAIELPDSDPIRPFPDILPCPTL